MVGVWCYGSANGRRWGIFIQRSRIGWNGGTVEHRSLDTRSTSRQQTSKQKQNEDEDEDENENGLRVDWTGAKEATPDGRQAAL